MERAVIIRRKTQFLRETFQISPIAQIGRQQHAGIRIAQIDRYRSGQRTRIAADQNFPVGVRCNRGCFHAAKVQPHDQIGNPCLIRKTFAQQQILLALVKGYSRPGGSVGIGVKIVDFLPVEPVNIDFLIDDARRYREIRRRFEGNSNAPAITLAAIDVLAPSRANRVNKTAIFGEIANYARCSLVAQRHIDGAFQMIADVIPIDEVHIGFDSAFGLTDLGLVGDIADGAADRA